jgi:hypothetical protein
MFSRLEGENPIFRHSHRIESQVQPAMKRVQRASFLGDSVSTVDARRRASRLADFPFPVLLTGETGCGKFELALLMKGNPRRALVEPLADIRCANLATTCEMVPDKGIIEENRQSRVYFERNRETGDPNLPVYPVSWRVIKGYGVRRSFPMISIFPFKGREIPPHVTPKKDGVRHSQNVWKWKVV